MKYSQVHKVKLPILFVSSLCVSAARRFITMSALVFLGLVSMQAQSIRVNPTGVNVNSQNATVVFLTFGQIPPGYVPAEAVWCGELVPATPPALGLQCRPDTIYGALPARYDRKQTTGNAGLTDIMTIPPSIVRRAYLAAVRGASAGFFYVRRFVSTTGGPDQFVNVTCRMTGGGARVPFALTNVEIKTDSKELVLFVKTGERFPNVVAEIQYNGTGRLKGRWEIVQPGEESPSETDLLTEATLPIEQRRKQRRFTQVARFSHFLPPSGKFILPLEAPERMPIVAEGQYLLLLRIEETDDKESDSDLSAVGVGPGVVHSGAVAAFPMPTLKFFVTGNRETLWQDSARLTLANITALPGRPQLVFTWRELTGTTAYHLQVSDETGQLVFSALLPSTATIYRAPSWFSERFARRNLTWRVIALDEKGRQTNETTRQSIAFQ